MGAIGKNSDRTDRSDVEGFGLFIGGEQVQPQANQYIDIENPYTREVWASAGVGTEADVNDAVSAAESAFEDQWEPMSSTRRREILNQIAAAIEDNVQELAELETRENGRTITDMKAELRAIPEWFRYYGSLSATQEGRVPPVNNKDGEMFNYVVKEPHGVVGGITAWNAPLVVATMKIAPALAAGNTFVHKPSEHTPVSAIRFAEIMYQETDLPAGVYNVVPGYEGEAGVPLVNHSGVDKVGFTGSVETGREVAKDAVDNLNPVMLELGGKSENIVFADADLENVVNGVMKGIFGGSGQVCTAGSRLIVDEEISDELVDMITTKTEQIEIGDPMDEDTDIGPIAFDSQCEKVKTHVEQASDEGAEINSVGSDVSDDDSDLFFSPTIVTEVDPKMSIACEEVFGPVLSVLTFEDESEAVEIANSVDYGLVSGVWTEDMRRAHGIVGEIEAGTVWVNEYRNLSYSTPFGGYGISGIGKENGKEGLEEFQRTKSIWYDMSGDVPNPFAEPSIGSSKE